MSDGQAGDPDGIPIGRALDVMAGLLNADLHEAVNVVSRIHGDGELPVIPIRLANLKTSERQDRVRRGQIVLVEATGQPVAIFVEVNEAHRVFAAIHEIGHLLDLSGIGTRGQFSSLSDDQLAGWRRAVARTRAAQQLGQLAHQMEPRVDHHHVATLLDPVEAWAPSYTQYIVNRSGSPTLRASLEAFRLRVPGEVYYPQQWEDDDFKAIDVTIEQLFRRLGWRRGPAS